MVLRRIDAFDTANAERLSDQLSRFQDDAMREFARKAERLVYTDWVSSGPVQAAYGKALRCDTATLAIGVAMPSVSLETVGVPVGVLKLGALDVTLSAVAFATLIEGSTSATLSTDGLYVYEHDGSNWYATSAGTGGGGGDVVGPAGAVAGNIAVFDGVTGKLIADGGAAIPGGGFGDVVGPASAVDNNFASYDTTTGKLIQDSGYSGTDILNRIHIYSMSGSGSDGNLTSAAGVTTLTKETYYDTVTLSGTAQIDTAGWALFIKTFDATNAPTRAIYGKGGDNSSPTTQLAVLAPVVGSYLGGGGGSTQGGLGGNPGLAGNVGSQPNALAQAGGGVGGSGGAGGNGNGGKLGAAGGAGGAITVRITNQAPHPIAPRYTASGTGAIFQETFGGNAGGSGGGGGGSGGINNGADGSSSGQGGRVVEVWIGELITGGSTPAALIDAYGGQCTSVRGTPSGGGGAGGAGGAGGGICRVFIGKRTGSAVTNLICANGGDGSTGGAANGGGTAGTGGQAGGGGEVCVTVLSTGVTYYKAFEPGGGPAASGTTGGVHTTWGVTV